MCFSENLPGDVYPRGVFFNFFQRSPSTFELHPRGDRLPQKIYIPPRGELRGYCGILTIPQKTFAYDLVTKYLVISEQDVPLRVGVKLETFDGSDEVEVERKTTCVCECVESICV